MNTVNKIKQAFKALQEEYRGVALVGFCEKEEIPEFSKQVDFVYSYLKHKEDKK